MVVFFRQSRAIQSLHFDEAVSAHETLAMQFKRTQLHRNSSADDGVSVRSKLSELARASNYAKDAACDSWQFAVEIGNLAALGMMGSDLRWLVMKGYVEYAIETTKPTDSSRQFKPCHNLAFSQKACFVITATGLAFLTSKVADRIGHHFSEYDAPTSNRVDTPFWDREGRILRVDKQIVKAYRVPSPNQEAILAAFQEEDWPRFVHDPLPPVAKLHPKQRLRETIRSLNTNQQNNRIRFQGDGTGERIGWRLIDAEQFCLLGKEPRLRHAA